MFIILLAALSLAVTPGFGQLDGLRLRTAEARPAKRLPAPAPSPDHMNFTDFEFLHPGLGHSGPDFWPLRGRPSAGARYVVEATISGVEAMSTAKFEALDETGRVIQFIPMAGEPGSPFGTRFRGLLVVPSRPFRVAFSGQAVDGRGYRRVYHRLFRPSHSPPAGPLLPRGIPPASARRLRRLVADYAREHVAGLERELSGRADGAAIVPRMRVSNVSYAPLLSAAGRTLGLRVTFDAEFSENNFYSLRLSVYTERTEWRGLVGMEVSKISVEPPPGGGSSAEARSDGLSFGMGREYRAGTTYHFTAELLPDFIRAEDGGKFCLTDQKGERDRAAWEATLASRGQVKYLVSVNYLQDFAGEIEGFPAPGELYRSFSAEGAKGCGSSRPAAVTIAPANLGMHPTRNKRVFFHQTH